MTEQDRLDLDELIRASNSLRSAIAAQGDFISGQRAYATRHETKRLTAQLWKCRDILEGLARAAIAGSER